MTNKTSTKRALFTSVMAMFLCFTMLLGTTFAWFTDSAASANNIIVAGNLDVEFYWSTDAISWTEMNENTNVFSSELWEPGHTEVVYLKVENKGTLALKYQLGVNVASETAGINESDEQFKLSSYIMYDVIETDVAFADRDAARQAVTNGKLIANSYSKAAELKTTNESDIVALVVYMPETVGNDVNYKTGTTAPTLSLGLNVLATQLAYENDSFGNQYDKDAPLLTWNGDIDTTWYVVGKTEYVLDTPAKLAGLAELVNSGNSFSGVTFKLGADINLDNIAWTPIGIKDANFNGSFNGNGYTIYNLKVSGTEGVGFIGIAGNAAHIENVHIVSANVVGTHYVGTVLGYGYLAANCLKFCDVEDAIVIANDDGKGNGDKVGAVAGWTANGNIIGNTATDCTVLGCRDIGGIVGYVNGENRAVEVSGNTVENVTVSVINVTDYAEPEKLGTNVMTVVGRTGSRVEVQTDNTAVDTSVKSAVANNKEELSTALGSAQSGSTIVLSEGEFTIPSMIDKEGITLIGANDGSTVVGGDDASTGFGSNFGKDTTIQNITFSGSSNGVRWSYANGGTSTFENCTFAGDSTYGFHIDQSNGATFIFNNCTFVGFNAFAGDLEKIVFNNCTFLNNGSYGHTNIWSTAEFNNCTWGDAASVSPRGDNAHLFFNGVEESYHHEYIGSAESLFNFAKSVNEGGDSWTNQAVILVADIDLQNELWTPIGQTGATEFKGIFDGQNHTIKNLNVDSSAQTGKHYSSGLFGWVEGKITIKNVKIDGAKVIGNHNVSALVGYTYSGQFSNCHVANAEIICNHANDDACGDKTGLIVGYAGDESRITDCSAIDSTVKGGRDAGQIIGAGYNVSVNGCSATSVDVSATGDCTGANVRNELIGRVLG